MVTCKLYLYLKHKIFLPKILPENPSVQNWGWYVLKRIAILKKYKTLKTLKPQDKPFETVPFISQKFLAIIINKFQC